jgi:hypothetical protein
MEVTEERDREGRVDKVDKKGDTKEERLRVDTKTDTTSDVLLYYSLVFVEDSIHVGVETLYVLIMYPTVGWAVLDNWGR